MSLHLTGCDRAVADDDQHAEDFLRPLWTEGVCGDGAVILRDGVPVPIVDVLAALNGRDGKVTP